MPTATAGNRTSGNSERQWCAAGWPGPIGWTQALAGMGAVLKLEGQTAPDENLFEIRVLLSTRRALVKDRTTAGTRPATASLSLVKRRINARIKQIEAWSPRIDAVMAGTVARGEAMSRKLAILITSPCIGEITALSMLIEMPELGTLFGKPAASPAGLEPISQQSGKWQGRERIRGGRFRGAPSTCPRSSRRASIRS